MHIRNLVFVLLILSLIGCGNRQGYRRYTRPQGMVRFGIQSANLVDQFDQSSLWVVIDIPYRGLQFERGLGKFTSRFEVTLALRDENGLAVDLVDASRTVHVDSYDTTQPDSLFARFSKYMHAPPGNYTLEAMVTDRVSGGRGFHHLPVEVRDLFANGLTVSDVLLLEEQPDSVPAEFHPIPSYRQRFNKKIYAFAQARNVIVGEQLRATLRIGNENDGSSSHAVLDTTASQKTVNLIFTIPPERLTLGRTALKIEVHSGESTVVARRPLMVRWASRPTSSQGLEDFVEPMRIIMNGKQWKELNNASPEEQDSLLEKFWNERNPTPELKTNLLEEEFYWRVEEANARFAWGKRAGWATDRGRVYIIYGPPDTVTRRSDRIGRNLEVWRYEDPPREFIFYDQHGDGRFHLIGQSHPS